MQNKLRNSAIAVAIVGAAAFAPIPASADSIHNRGDFGGTWNRIGPTDVGYRHRHYSHRHYGYRSYGYYAPRYRYYGPSYSYYRPYPNYYYGPGVSVGGPGFSVGIY
jgi:hypothetical protein